ncbi:MAG: flavodoxin [bacterium P3]|nr:MAG: flavodoxin [bacterium P3]KWW40140.1 MAG: flavodoxin [bacterium F083]
MTTAIRYFSKFGHSAAMADAIGQVTGAKPETVNVPVDTPVDTLYLGAGVMFGKINGAMADFIKTLSPDKVKRVVCFGSCAIIKSPVPQMRSLLEAQGVTVDGRSFTCRGSMGPLHAGHPDREDMDSLRAFIRTTL